MIIDQYRVKLFKDKLRGMLSNDIEKIRFEKSKGGCHFLIDPNRYYERDEVVNIIEKAFKRNGIEYLVKKNPFGLYSDRPEEERPAWYISVPIDQEALPERKRR